MNWYLYEKKRKLLLNQLVFLMWNWHESLLWVFFWRYQMMYLRASSMADNGNTYFKCVSIFLDVNLARNKVSVTLFTCYCFMSQFHENKMSSMKMDLCILFSVQVRIFKKHWLMKIIFLKTKTNFHILLCEWVPLSLDQSTSWLLHQQLYILIRWSVEVHTSSVYMYLPLFITYKAVVKS